jgi:hypothetical protein
MQIPFVRSQKRIFTENSLKIRSYSLFVIDKANFSSRGKQSPPGRLHYSAPRRARLSCFFIKKQSIGLFFLETRASGARVQIPGKKTRTDRKSDRFLGA